jgi:hypothetical protein
MGAQIHEPSRPIATLKRCRPFDARFAAQTKEPRRSIQGAYIRRDDEQGTNQAARIRPDTLGRIGALARHVLNIEAPLPIPDVRV